MGNFFSKSRADADIQEGGFIQRVHIYSELDPKVIKRGTVLLDSGNGGPNLITNDAMRYVYAQPAGPGLTIITYDGVEREVGGEVVLTFSGPGPKKRYYTETFRHVPFIVEGIDMVLNHDFYIKVFPNKIPSMLMIRAGGNNQSEDQKRQREAHKRKQEENAQRQEAERQEELRATEEKRLAEEAQCSGCSNHSSGENNSSSG